jgi:hypothetical protein
MLVRAFFTSCILAVAASAAVIEPIAERGVPPLQTFSFHTSYIVFNFSSLHPEGVRLRLRPRMLQ